MKNILLIVCVLIGFLSCKKDKFTTAPQLRFKSVSPNVTSIELGSTIPDITFSITDKEGDIGFKNGTDTAFIYLKNNLTGKSDSLPFPDLQAAGKNNFKADVTVSIASVLECKSLPGGALHTDTLYFDVYVRDFERNKSNIITTSDPVYFSCR
jgi:hypothetical protein